MKKYLLFLMLNCFTLMTFAQLVQNPENPSGVGSAYDSSIGTGNFEIENQDLVNGIDFNWRIVRVDVPNEWEFQICDKVTCYFFGQMFNPPGSPNIFTAGEVFGGYSVKVKPNEVAYNGYVEMELINVADPTDIYLTIPINFDALPSSVDNTEKENQISVYPNPTTDFFSVQNANNVAQIKLYNIVGKEAANFEYRANASYNVTKLLNGMYLIRLFDTNNEVVKVLRLNKR